MDLRPLLLFGLIILSTHTLEGITGFGCTIIAMPFAIMLFDLETGRAALTFTALIQCLFIFIKDRRKIAGRELTALVIFMGIGLPLGMLLYNYLPQAGLKKILAVFTCLVSIRGLFIFFRFKNRERENNKPLPGWALKILLVLGGIIHGAFTSGGPLAIIYTMEKIKEKTVFRATMCTLWSIMNTILIIQLVFSGRVPAFSLRLVLFSLPFLAGGIALGNLAHKHIRDTIFTPLSYGILLSTSFVMFIF
jgi:uncharacterized membrane protein YfcA